MAEIYDVNFDMNQTSGSTAAYYASFLGTPQLFPAVQGRVPGLRRVDTGLNISITNRPTSWPGTNGQFSTYFLVRWSGALMVSTSGYYTFQLSDMDDAAGLWVNGTRVCASHGGISCSGTVRLLAGVASPLAVFYLQLGGAMSVVLSWSATLDSGGVVPLTTANLSNSMFSYCAAALAAAPPPPSPPSPAGASEAPVQCAPGPGYRACVPSNFTVCTVAKCVPCPRQCPRRRLVAAPYTTCTRPSSASAVPRADQRVAWVGLCLRAGSTRL